MSKSILLFVFTSFATSFFCQSIQTKYYKDQWLSKEVSAEKGKYSKTISQESDGTVTTEVKNMATGETTLRESRKGSEPVGLWYKKDENGIRELNYDFPLRYSQEKCDQNKMAVPVSDFTSDNDSLSYKAPGAPNGEKNIFVYLMRKIQMPSICIEQGVQGKVFLVFTIEEDGSTSNCYVMKGVHPEIDKEALRVVRELRFSSPPMLNGKPLSTCVNLPINFKVR